MQSYEYVSGFPLNVISDCDRGGFPLNVISDRGRVDLDIAQ